MPNLIPYSAFFDLSKNKGNNEYELQFINTNGDSFIVVTKNNQIYLIYDINEKTPQRKLISLEGF